MSPEPALGTRRGERGASLIELVVAIAIIAVAMTGTMLLVDTTSRRSAEPMLERQAISLADATLEEVLARPYLDPDDGSLCGPPEARRDLFDDVCDYDGLVTLGARDQFNLPIAGLEAFRVEVAIDRGARLESLVGASDVLRVDTAVTDPLGRVFRFSGYRTSP